MTNPQPTTETTPQTHIPETVVNELKQQYQENLRLIEEKYQTLLAAKDKQLEILKEQYEAVIKQYQASLTDKEEQYQASLTDKEEHYQASLSDKKEQLEYMEKQYQQLLAVKDSRLENLQKEIKDLREENKKIQDFLDDVLSRLQHNNNDHLED